jgi:uncharacterized BrkB/YihY/UPF0761 family membrane protein
MSNFIEAKIYAMIIRKICATRIVIYRKVGWVLGLPCLCGLLVSVAILTGAKVIEKYNEQPMDFAEVCYWSKLVSIIVAILVFVVTFYFVVDRPFVRNCEPIHTS